MGGIRGIADRPGLTATSEYIYSVINGLSKRTATRGCAPPSLADTSWTKFTTAGRPGFKISDIASDFVPFKLSHHPDQTVNPHTLPCSPPVLPGSPSPPSLPTATLRSQLGPFRCTRHLLYHTCRPDHRPPPCREVPMTRPASSSQTRPSRPSLPGGVEANSGHTSDGPLTNLHGLGMQHAPGSRHVPGANQLAQPLSRAAERCFRPTASNILGLLVFGRWFALTLFCLGTAGKNRLGNGQNVGKNAGHRHRFDHAHEARALLQYQ